jgi:hypothetical protein
MFIINSGSLTFAWITERISSGVGMLMGAFSPFTSNKML